MTSYVEYLRVSTDRQGRSGLGIEAQREAVRRILRDEDRIVASYTETESGKVDHRPQLQAALARCRELGATLILGKLDRPSRNVAFIAGLLDSGVRFTAADMPNAGRFEMHIRAALAEEERRLISERTRQALVAARARGAVLGGYRGRSLTRDEQEHGRQASCEARQRKAARHRAAVGPMIQELQAAGTTSLAGIAKALNAAGVGAPRGGLWGPAQVRRVVAAG